MATGLVLGAAALCATFAAQAVQVRSVSPSGEVGEVQQVLLRFGAPVVPFGAPRLADPALLRCDGLATAPSTPSTPPGQGRWLGPAEWAYELREALPPGVRCTLALRPNWQPSVAVQAASGAATPSPSATLDGPREFHFSTAGPTVQQVWPWEGAEVEEEAHWLLQLNGPVQGASLADHAWCEVQGIGERIPLVLVDGPARAAVLKARRVGAAQAERSLLLRCQRPLPAGATVRLVWGAGIASARNPQVLTRETRSWQWTVRAPFSAEFACERERAEAPCLPLRPLRLRFSAPVPRALAEQIRLVPQTSAPAPAQAGLAPRFDADDRAASVSEIAFPSPLPEQARYLLTLPAGLRDESGRALSNASAFPLATGTGPMPPLAKFAAAPFGVIEAGTPTEPAALPITLRHVQQGDGRTGRAVVAVKRLDASTPDIELLRWHARLARYHESRLTAREAGLPQASWWVEGAPREDAGRGTGRAARERQERLVGSRELSLLAKEGGVQRSPLPGPPTLAKGASAAASAADARATEVIGLPLAQPGYHLVEIESRLLGQALLASPAAASAASAPVPLASPAAPMYVRTGVLVTNLGVHFKRGRSSSLVWVSTLDRARPVEGAEVAVNDCRGQRLWAGRTDAAGLARIPRGFADEVDSEAGPRCIGEAAYFVTARKAQPSSGGGSADGSAVVTDLAFVFSHWNRGIETWRFNHPTASGTESDLRVHTLLDRSLLRAGDTVSMKHLVRAETERGLALVNAADWPTELQITHQGSGEVTRIALPAQPANAQATPLRALPMQWAIPATAKLGRYELTLHRGARQWSAGAFRVEAFRVPLVDARLSLAGAAKGPLVAPQALNFAVQLNHLSGGGVAAPASFSALLREREPAFAGYEDYSFSAPRERAAGSLPDADGAGEGAGDGAYAPAQGRLVADRLALRTDAQGAATVALAKLPALAGLKRPAELVAELSFDDPNGERQTVAQTLPVWPAALQVGLRARSWLAQRGRVPLQAVVLDTAGKPQAGRTVEVRARVVRLTSTRQRVVGGFYAYDDRQEVQELGPVCGGRTDARGLLVCDSELTQAGEVELIARVADDAGRATEAATSVWISGSGEQWFAQDNDDRIDLLPEKRELAPGETARLQVRMPFREATVLVTVEREGVLDSRVLTLRGSDPVIELPIPVPGAGAAGATGAVGEASGWAPNVYVSALVLRGRVRHVPWYSFFDWGWRAPLDWLRAWRHEGSEYQPPTAMVDLARPAFKLGVAQLRIGLAAHRLDVKVETDRPQYGPRQTVHAQVQVTRGGQPVAGGEIAFAAVDEGLLALAPNESWQLLEQMYQPRPWGVETSTAQNEIVGRRHYGRKALPPGGGGGLNPTRELFDTLLLWRAVVKLDAQGRARIDVPLNDSLTAFRLIALADAGADRFGSGHASIRVTQDLQLIAGLPTVVRQGDRFEALFTVRNTTDRAVTLDATLKATVTQGLAAELPAPGTTATLAGSTVPLALPAQRLQLGANAAAELRWPVTVPAAASALAWEAAVVEVNRDGGAQLTPQRDALRFTQRVEPAQPLRVLQASLQQIDGSLQIPVAPPGGGAGGAAGGVVAELRPRLAGALPGIRRWFEAYPYTCLEQRASRAIGLRDLAGWKALLGELPGYLDGDGLAHYFPPRAEDGPGGGSDRLSAYLLALADTAGWPLPPELRDRLLDGLTAFVEGRIERHFPAPRADRDVRKLAALEALSRHGRAQARQLASLEITPTQWPTSALLDWLALLQRVDGVPQRDARLAEAQRLLRARLLASGSTLRFADEAGDAWSWLMEGPDANAARLLLLAVHSSDPAWHGDAPRLAAGLALRLHGGDGPQRDALANGAFGSTTANAWASLAFEQFSLQRESQQVTGRTRVSLGTAVRELDWSRRAEGERLTLPWPAQAGTLQVQQQGGGRPWLALQSLSAAPLTAPVAAGYRLERSVSAVEQKTPGRWSRGDVLRVQLVVDAQADLGWVVVSDPVPAGATLLGSGLGRDSQIATARSRAAGEGGDSGSAWLAYEERRPDAWRAYYRWLPRGRHTLSYTLRLNTVGRFALPPSRVEAMYAPQQHAELPLAPVEVGP
ncbi:alpha-2-macroglobulin family protein [Sphaerotilus microaerophilus]|nr:MG2 domain-containing protein [Sphaerotilus sp. FB-5]